MKILTGEIHCLEYTAKTVTPWYPQGVVLLPASLSPPYPQLWRRIRIVNPWKQRLTIILGLGWWNGRKIGHKWVDNYCSWTTDTWGYYIFLFTLVHILKYFKIKSFFKSKKVSFKEKLFYYTENNLIKIHSFFIL